MNLGKCLFIFVFLFAATASADVNLYVAPAPDGYDSAGCGAASTPCNTLEWVHDQRILVDSQNQVLETHNIILRAASNGDTVVSIIPDNSSAHTLTWTKSGTSAHPIKISSQSARISLSGRLGIGYKILFRDVSHVTVDTLKLLNFTNGIRMANCDSCTIANSEFVGEDSTPGTSGGAMIWIGEIGDLPDELMSWDQIVSYLLYPEYAYSESRSDFVSISNNYFHGGSVEDETYDHKWHHVYVSNGSNNISIVRNTFETGIDSGGAVQFNHGLSQFVDVSFNICRTYNDISEPNSVACVIARLASDDNFVEQKNIGFHDNFVDHNWLHSANASTETLPTPIDTLTTTSANIIVGSSNHFYYGQGLEPYDPYWLGYGASNSSRRTVSGDFDGDLKSDDIATIYSYGSFATRIHVFLSNGNSFAYSGSTGWWSSNGYDAPCITDRVVVGNFNNDPYDDIAAFCDGGGSQTTIHVWTGDPLDTNSDGFKFNYSNSAGWWNSTGYTASKITGRVVAGRFNNDSYDDIAAFYDYGSGGTRIHVWTGDPLDANSDGFKFNYSNSAGWWNSTGYTASKITGRVVAGRFNNDSYDDIAAFYDYGNGETRIHVWTGDPLDANSNGFKFNYSNSAGWWSSTGYIAPNITSRVVSGRFDGDSYSDIAAFFDYGNGETRVHVWTGDPLDGNSDGFKFNYSNSAGWWSSTGYSASNITGRVVPGRFNSDTYDDIAAFYDMADGASVRTHVWLSLGSGALSYQTPLGYPWLLIP